MPLGEHFSSVTTGLWQDTDMQKYIDQAFLIYTASAMGKPHPSERLCPQFFRAALCEPKALHDVGVPIADVHEDANGDHYRNR